MLAQPKNQKKYLQDFILERCGGDLERILRAPNPELYYGLPINVLELMDWNEEAGDDCLSAPLAFSAALDRAIQSASSSLLPSNPSWSGKANVTARFWGLPCTPWTFFERLPCTKSVHRLVCLRGTVIRVAAVRMQELKRSFECQKCGQTVTSLADDWNGGGIAKPLICSAEIEGIPCRSTKFTDVTREQVHVDYQEVKVQECTGVLAVGSVPRSLPCILKHELVDSCRAGEEVLITGVLGARPKRAGLKDGVKMDGELFLLASSVQPFNSSAQAPEHAAVNLQKLWLPQMSLEERFARRDRIIQTFCPGLHGMFLVKMAVLLTVIGGTAAAGTLEGGDQRREGHILLVGDPGTGKSQFLLNATKLLPRSLIVSGSGTTAAGLTACAVKDSTNHWSLEAGALVLADRGICAIDEFGGMKKQDRAAVHEAMEQQTVSIAKAGIVCKLNTRCSVVAACNPQSSFDDAAEGVTASVAIASPLLSRFDLILMLSDRERNRSDGWDERLADEILETDETHSEVVEEEVDFDLAVYVGAVREENPQLNEAATLVLSRYYRMLRAADPSAGTRTTPRLLGSLARLACAHAKLTGRAEAGLEDAAVAVLLMERSLGVRPLLRDFEEELGLFEEAPPFEYYQRFQRELLGKLEIRLEAISGISEDSTDEQSEQVSVDDEFDLIDDIADLDTIDDVASVAMAGTQFTCATSK